ncbi:MAG: exopolyphosphatase, partial [Duodenibacillus sp.]|nr:exopolyphosphatase [Duodenibacillus sp.]
KRTGIDKQQASRVASLADALFTALLPATPDRQQHDQRKLLQWAAALHEAGRMISPNGYHHHSRYILEHCDMPGFSRSEQQRLGQLALAQRGRLQKVRGLLDDDAARRMVLALRLAVIFAHQRSSVRMPRFEIAAGPRGCALSLERSWCDRHPLLAFMLENERQIWLDAGFEFELSAAARG